MNGWLAVDEIQIMYPILTAPRVRYLAMRDKWDRVRLGRNVFYSCVDVARSMTEFDDD